MRVLFEMTDAPHVHLFKYVIWELERRGHAVAITARDRDILTRLLRAYGFEFTLLSRQGKGMLGMGMELLVRDWRLWRFARRFRPDLFVGWVGPSACHVGFLMRKPVLVVEDAEYATLQQRLSFPFATRIVTATHYEKDWGAKHVRYESFDQLAYVHPNHFRPDRAVVERAGLSPGAFIVVRFLSWGAAHDVGVKGMDATRRLALLERLERFGRVVVSSEAPLPGEFERFRLPVPPHEFLDLLGFARLYLGEGSSVAVEAALMGVPAIFVSPVRLGYMTRLEREFELAFSRTDSEDALALAERLLGDPATPALWQERRRRLLEQEQDLVPWLVEQVETFDPARGAASLSRKEREEAKDAGRRAGDGGGPSSGSGLSPLILSHGQKGGPGGWFRSLSRGARG